MLFYRIISMTEAALPSAAAAPTTSTTHNIVFRTS